MKKKHVRIGKKLMAWLLAALMAITVIVPYSSARADGQEEGGDTSYDINNPDIWEGFDKDEDISWSGFIHIPEGGFARDAAEYNVDVSARDVFYEDVQEALSSISEDITEDDVIAWSLTLSQEQENDPQTGERYFDENVDPVHPIWTGLIDIPDTFANPSDGSTLKAYCISEAGEVTELSSLTVSKEYTREAGTSTVYFVADHFKNCTFALVKVPASSSISVTVEWKQYSLEGNLEYYAQNHESSYVSLLLKDRRRTVVETKEVPESAESVQTITFDTKVPVQEQTRYVVAVTDASGNAATSLQWNSSVQKTDAGWTVTNIARTIYWNYEKVMPDPDLYERYKDQEFTFRVTVLERSTKSSSNAQKAPAAQTSGQVSMVTGSNETLSALTTEELDALFGTQEGAEVPKAAALSKIDANKAAGLTVNTLNFVNGVADFQLKPGEGVICCMNGVASYNIAEVDPGPFEPKLKVETRNRADETLSTESGSLDVLTTDAQGGVKRVRGTEEVAEPASYTVSPGQKVIIVGEQEGTWIEVTYTIKQVFLDYDKETYTGTGNEGTADIKLTQATPGQEPETIKELSENIPDAFRDVTVGPLDPGKQYDISVDVDSTVWKVAAVDTHLSAEYDYTTTIYYCKKDKDIKGLLILNKQWDIHSRIEILNAQQIEETEPDDPIPLPNQKVSFQVVIKDHNDPDFSYTSPELDWNAERLDFSYCLTDFPGTVNGDYYVADEIIKGTDIDFKLFDSSIEMTPDGVFHASLTNVRSNLTVQIRKSWSIVPPAEAPVLRSYPKAMTSFYVVLTNVETNEAYKIKMTKSDDNFVGSMDNIPSGKYTISEERDPEGDPNHEFEKYYMVSASYTNTRYIQSMGGCQARIFITNETKGNLYFSITKTFKGKFSNLPNNVNIGDNVSAPPIDMSQYQVRFYIYAESGAAEKDAADGDMTDYLLMVPFDSEHFKSYEKGSYSAIIDGEDFPEGTDMSKTFYVVEKVFDKDGRMLTEDEIPWVVSGGEEQASNMPGGVYLINFNEQPKYVLYKAWGDEEVTDIVPEKPRVGVSVRKSASVDPDPYESILWREVKFEVFRADDPDKTTLATFELPRVLVEATTNGTRGYRYLNYLELTAEDLKSTIEENGYVFDPAAEYHFREVPIEGWVADQDEVTPVIYGNPLTEEEDLLVGIHNLPIGNISVTKTVSGMTKNTDKDTAFPFEVRMENAAGKTYETSLSTEGSTKETTGEITFDQDGLASFTLKDGQTLTIKGLVYNSKFTVHERTEDLASHYTVQMTDPFGNTVTGSEENGWSVTGLVPWKRTAASAFENRVDTSLVVTKQVTGEKVTQADKEKEFSFTLTLSGTADDGTQASEVTGQYGKVSFREGTASFQLKDGESLTVNGLPSGLHYTVTEEASSSFKVSGTVTVVPYENGTPVEGQSQTTSFDASAAEGTLVENAQQTVAVINTKQEESSEPDSSEPSKPENPHPGSTPPTHSPKTGDTSSVGSFLTLLFSTVILLVVAVVLRKKRREA